MNYQELREKFQTFEYNGFDIVRDNDALRIKYYFNIPGLTEFNPTLTIDNKYIRNNNVDEEYLKYLVFHVGMVEIISYWKSCMPKKLIVRCGYLNDEQKAWFKKLYYYGLGEFMYVNKINLSLSEFLDIVVEGEEKNYNPVFNGVGNLIPVGGGKDSCVSMNLLKSSYDINDCVTINPKEAHLACIDVGGYRDKHIIIKRTIDGRLLQLNTEGYLNGHTPFSALVSFVTLLVAYLSNKKYIILSNESSANESNIEGTKINHQYSKTYEYENDFNNYVNKYLKIDIKYFSLLRPLTELQIAYLFSRYKEYHPVFKSCNVGSKGEKWNWCCNCPKCLFVYIVLSPFLPKEEMVSIFKEEMFSKENLLETFLELTGNSTNKPFECVGTYEEVNYAISRTIENYQGELPYLLKYYKEHFELVPENGILKSFNNENNLPEQFIDIVRNAINE